MSTTPSASTHQNAHQNAHQKTGPRAAMSARTRQRRTAAASVVGSILEWYDFFLFGASAAIVFNKVFFPNVSPFAATLASFATFGLGFAVRPIGGLVLAHLGDRIGRRPVLILTVVLMGAGTLAIGFLPTYHQIGIWAPVLLVLCRMMQGFGIGAELGGAYVMSTEAAKAEKRGFYGSLPGAGEFIGVVIASGAVAAVSTLPEDDFLGWGWRIPFLASALVVIIALVIRNAAPETEQFEATRDSGKREKLPVLAAIKSRPKAIALLIGSGCATAIASYAIQGYLPSYLTNQLGLSSGTSVLGITIASAISILTIPLAGALSDRVGRKPVMIGGAVSITLFAYPFFWLVDTREPWLIYLAITVAFALMLNSIFAVTGTFYAESLPTEVRYSGLVFVREINGVIFAGTSPFVATLLVDAGGDRPWYLAGYMAAAGLASALCVWRLPETAPARAKG
ncbi:MFS transporter [Streptomyces sp. NBC_01361]|uniref:MFS transporter n=1 Tax=Streptomyces sp. NBC_01361 TaxID=2903838 RepID=UPI002E363B53|nr:MFS transporter [Streptomyces sp. NBC_01361]